MTSHEMLLTHPVFPRLKQHILTQTGLNYYEDKDADFAQRVTRRVSKLAIKNWGDYLAVLESPAGQDELRGLVCELTIDETYFFRHSEQFDALRELIIPDILKQHQNHRNLKIWSAGCSIGAEPYSLSILLKTQFQQQFQDWNVSILGTDINNESLEKARIGRFGDWAMRTMPEELKQRCFSKSGNNWEILPEYRKNVTFQNHNLITDTFPFQEYDIVLCRNVVIYFSNAEFSRLVSRIQSSLRTDGWLLVGHAEPNTETFRAFRMVSFPGAILYRLSAENELPEQRALENRFESFTTPLIPELAPISDLDELKPLNELPGVISVPGHPLPADAPLDLKTVRELADKGKWNEAAEYCELLIKQDNLVSAVHMYFGLILEHLGRHAESEQALKRAVYLDRQSALAHYHYGLRQQKNFDSRGAARSFENVISLLEHLDPDHIVCDADCLTAADLQTAARAQLEALSGHA